MGDKIGCVFGVETERSDEPGIKGFVVGGGKVEGRDLVLGEAPLFGFVQVLEVAGVKLMSIESTAGY